MMYGISPKRYRLEHEIKMIEKRLHDAEMHYGDTHPSIVNNYREMIRNRRELISMLALKHRAMH